MVPRFEIHLEEWNHALHIDGMNHQSDLSWLINLLERNSINPDIYVLEKWKWENPADYDQLELGYDLKSHGTYHYYDEKADRSPYFNQEGIPFPPSGGFFFRIMPMWYLKWAINKSGMFWIHPHDLDENHPRLSNPIMDFKRRIGLKGARRKLERLIKEVTFRG